MRYSMVYIDKKGKMKRQFLEIVGKIRIYKKDMKIMAKNNKIIIPVAGYGYIAPLRGNKNASIKIDREEKDVKK